MVTTCRVKGGCSVRRILNVPMVMAVLVVAACNGNGVSATVIPSTVGSDRVCRMLSASDVRTVAGSVQPKVRRENINLDPVQGWLLGAACILDAGDVSLSLTVDWVSQAADRTRAKAELSTPADSDARMFPAEAGTGFVRTTRSTPSEVSGSLLRGQYRIDVSLAGAPKVRDAAADAQALVLQVAEALAIPVSESAARPKAPRD
ncbi:MAG: hypothetical protein QG622_12 [Actinomycetota bacterium]|nr:hypothetical protein [Actinomycetota bacterium]